MGTTLYHKSSLWIWMNKNNDLMVRLLEWWLGFGESSPNCGKFGHCPARIHVHLTHLSSIKTLRALGDRVLPDVSGWCELLHTWPLYLHIVSMSSLQEEPWWKAFLRKYQKHIQLFLILLGVLAAWPGHWVLGVVLECGWFNAPGFPIHNFGNL